MKEQLLNLLDYEYWANSRIINTLETLDKTPPRALAVMGHILAAQQIWLGRITKESTFVSIWEDIPVVWMVQTAERQHQRAITYLSSQSDTDLQRVISYRSFAGDDLQDTLLDILTHLSHHAAYHRGQVVQLIRPLLDKAPVTDYIIWAKERAAKSRV